MYELIKISENDYYMDSPSKIGIVKVSDNEVVFIDGGSSKDSAKKALRLIEGQGWTLRAVYNTHSHADHIGGNRLLQERTGCKVYARGAECAATNYPLSEPAILYGGYPFPKMTGKFFLAEKCNAEPLTEENLPAGFDTVDLSGHCYEMVGYITPDGNAFIGDAVAPAEVLEKYGVSYLWNIRGFLESLERLKAVKANKFIPSHGDTYDSIEEIAELNRVSTLELADKITDFCEDGIGFDMLLKKVFDSYGIDMSPQQNVLVGSTVRTYLSWCIEENKLEYYFEDNIMYFKKIDG